MIRKFEKNDIDGVMQIWLSGNLDAHSFISDEYWKSNYNLVQEQIQQADIFVYEDKGRICGFIGIVEGYIAGIFVDKDYRNHGIGKMLIEYVKQYYDVLTLNVYRKNERAVSFYHRQGFSTVSESIDCDTNEVEYKMKWES